MRLVRGPFLKLPPHQEHTDDAEVFLKYAKRLKRTGAPLAADFFSGAGGLSLGLEQAGFKVILSADHEPFAIRTHAHHFGGMSVDWDLSDPDVVKRVAELVTAAGVDLVAGGPPCQPFSKAGRSMLRYRVQEGLRDPHDERRDLWRSFLEIIDRSRPKAVLMENVPDMALDREMFILRSMVEELEQIGYSVEERVVDTWRYGVPQFRQRLILVALRDNIEFRFPEETEDKVSVWTAIGDLPEVEGGWRPEGGEYGWAEYSGPVTDFQKEMRSKVAPADENKVFDHITRPVREDDRLAFESMTHASKYTDLSKEHQRYRGDIFDDKYNRLNENDLSRTITAHIAKDGYWYIHPRQSRTLTVREAARLQTFPDHFRFDGPPSAAFRQIGNAVPPRLGYVMGAAIRDSLGSPKDAGISTRETAERLARFWLDGDREQALPWLRSSSRWLLIAGEELLDRAPRNLMKPVWKLLLSNDRPWKLRKRQRDEFADDLALFINGSGREQRLARILALLGELSKTPEALDGPAETLRSVLGLAESVADLAILATPRESTADRDSGPEEPVLVTKGVLRVASRFQENDVDRRNRLTDGRLAVARMIGMGEHSRNAHLGLIELANLWCRPVDPVCPECPINAHCRDGQRRRDDKPTLYD
ncbi:DNA (cytosine-5-)-methyltransferase [Mycolicibacterium gadium]|uniref:DNA (cytosine-5-)-methyltransferase n=1 Tax=Mycolicibacterium gadium TaxID=1794 RepID=UPI0021F2B5A4|nr:DNA (cytosine-5-)-methyltransferase [Mycolicibacterium gadium]